MKGVLKMTDDEVKIKIIEVEQRSKSNSHRLDEVEKRQSDSDKMLNSIALIAQRQDTMETDVKEIKSDVKTLTSKPAKHWDNLIEKLVIVLVTAFVTYALARIGM